MIVVDTNVITYFVLQQARTEQARSLYQLDGDWRVPPLWRYEFLNVLANFSRHAGEPSDLLESAWRNAVNLLGDKETQPDMIRALQLASRHDISAYDAQYVALANELGVPLVTEDKRLRRQRPDFVLSIEEYQSSYNQKNEQH